MCVCVCVCWGIQELSCWVQRIQYNTWLYSDKLGYRKQEMCFVGYTIGENKGQCMCVCVCAFVSHINRGGQLVCTRLHTGESGRHSETVELRVFILP